MSTKDKKDKDESFLVCMRVGEIDTVVHGSTKKNCSTCGHLVWVSAASLAISKEKKLPLLCMQCAQERAAFDDDLQIVPPSPEQLKEVRDAIIRDHIERG